MKLEDLFNKWETYFQIKQFENIISQEPEDLQSFFALTYLIRVEYKNIKAKYLELKNVNKSRKVSIDSPDIFKNNSFDKAFVASPSSASTLDSVEKNEDNLDQSPTISKKNKRLRNINKARFKHKLDFSNGSDKISNLANRLKVNAKREMLDLDISTCIPVTPDFNLTKKISHVKKPKLYEKKNETTTTLTQMFQKLENNTYNKEEFRTTKISADLDDDETFFEPKKDLRPKLESPFLVPQNKSFTTGSNKKDYKFNKNISNPKPVDESIIYIKNDTLDSDETMLSERDFDEYENKSDLIKEKNTLQKILQCRKSKSPGFAYKENLPKKREERLQLKGWECADCKEFYGNRSDLSETQIQELKNKCSKHRGKFNPRPNTPEGFWNPLISSQFSENSMIENRRRNK